VVNAAERGFETGVERCFCPQRRVWFCCKSRRGAAATQPRGY
jgi:hypothetical protein